LFLLPSCLSIDPCPFTQLLNDTTNWTCHNVSSSNIQNLLELAPCSTPSPSPSELCLLSSLAQWVPLSNHFSP
jgi:hypothetical protein